MHASDLPKLFAKAEGLSVAQAKMVTDRLLTGIADAAAAGEGVNLPGFGKFKVKDMPARSGRNPSPVRRSRSRRRGS